MWGYGSQSHGQRLRRCDLLPITCTCTLRCPGVVPRNRLVLGMWMGMSAITWGPYEVQGTVCMEVYVQYWSLQWLNHSIASLGGVSCDPGCCRRGLAACENKLKCDLFPIVAVANDQLDDDAPAGLLVDGSKPRLAVAASRYYRSSGRLHVLTCVALQWPCRACPGQPARTFV